MKTRWGKGGILTWKSPLDLWKDLDGLEGKILGNIKEEPFSATSCRPNFPQSAVSLLSGMQPFPPGEDNVTPPAENFDLHLPIKCFQVSIGVRAAVRSPRNQDVMSIHNLWRYVF